MAIGQRPPRRTHRRYLLDKPPSCALVRASAQSLVGEKYKNLGNPLTSGFEGRVEPRPVPDKLLESCTPELEVPMHMLWRATLPRVCWKRLYASLLKTYIVWPPLEARLRLLAQLFGLRVEEHMFRRTSKQIFDSSASQ